MHIWTLSASPHKEYSEPVVQDSVPSPPLPAAEGSGVLMLPRMFAQKAMVVLLTEARRDTGEGTKPGERVPGTIFFSTFNLPCKGE